MRKLLIAFLVFAMFGSVLLSTAATAHAESIALFEIDPVIIQPLPIITIDPALLNQKTLYASPVYRMRIIKPVGSISLDYFRYTSSEDERTYLKTLGYADHGIIGYVSKAWLPNTYALRRWTYAGRLDYLTLSTNSYTSYGYAASGVLGYAMGPVLPAPSGTHNLYRYFRPIPPGLNTVWTNHLFTTNTTSPYSGYMAGGLTFRLWSSAVELQKITVTPFSSALTGTTTAQIKWTRTRSSGFVDILYSTDGGTNYSTIASKVANSGQYAWTVPNVTSDNCHIMVRWTADPTRPASAWGVGAKFTINRNMVFAPFLDFSLVPLLEFPPAAPTALTATAGDATPMIKLTWTDNSPNEDGFLVQRMAEGGTWADLATTAASVTALDDTTVTAGVLYSYQVKALGAGSAADSAFSDAAQAIYYLPDTPPEDMVPETPTATVEPPTNLEATQMPGANRPVRLTWDASASTVLGYAVERRIDTTWEEIGRLDNPATLTYTDTGVADESITEVSYRVFAVGELADSAPTDPETLTLTPVTTPEPTPATKVIRLRIGNTGYSVNGTNGMLDAAPTIMNSRTMLPIRAIVEGLGGTIAWDPGERRVTAVLGANEVAVWIDNPLGRVNSVYMAIDPENSLVMPVIVPPGRTLLPVRFITEKLGCDVDWNEELQEVTITYPAVTP